MIQRRSSEERGRGAADWLKSRHSFSFANYHDPRHMGFRGLRVLNEDWIAPASGFGAHPHRDMEILTYPIAGTLEHSDDQGTRSRLVPGRIQLMTAGTGIVHSEINPSATEPLHLLQIWLLPDRAGHAPRYQEREIDPSAVPLHTLVTPDGRDGTLQIHQDASVDRLLLHPGEPLEYQLKPGRHAWLQLVHGDLSLNGLALSTGDGAAVSDEAVLQLAATNETEALLFDLA